MKLTTTAIVAACHSKACAPPPAGRGGSNPNPKASDWDVPGTTRVKRSKAENASTDRLLRRLKVLHAKKSNEYESTGELVDHMLERFFIERALRKRGYQFAQASKNTNDDNPPAYNAYMHGKNAKPK